MSSAEAFGLYLHIPYCKSICPYCDFNVHIAKPRPWTELLDAMLAEWQCRGQHFEQRSAATLYFGGGTPSLAPVSFIARCIEHAHANYGLPEDAEVTLEVEPNTVDPEKLAALFEAGVNRLSLGWQSTQPHVLRVLGRGHGPEDSHDAYRWARQAGFQNISIDLIFAVPGQSMDDLRADLDALIALRPEHVSLYCLTWHAGTHCYRRLAQGRLARVDEAIEVEMMEVIHERLEAAGLEQYEISNYARSGFRSVHNGSYWRGVEYLGVGPGAHSFRHDAWTRGWRTESKRSPNTYMAYWTSKPGAREAGADYPGGVEWHETLTARQLLSERLLCAVRMPDSIHIADLPGAGFGPEVHRAAQQAADEGWVIYDGVSFSPTAEGLRRADALALLFV